MSFVSGSVDAPERAIRVSFIDAVRGLCLSWMVAAHALTLAAVPSGHWLQWLRPRGWATIGFVMLTGLATAMRYGRGGQAVAPVRRRLFRRAAGILVIAIVSNVFFHVAESAVSGALSPERWLAILSFRMPWTISSILLSPVIVLAILPALPRLVRRIGAGATFALVTLAVLLFDYACTSASGPGGATLLMRYNESVSAYFGFSLLTTVVLSVWAFALGTLRNAHPSVPIFKWCAVASVTVLIVRAWLPWPHALLVAAQFGTTCLMVRAISSVGLFAPAVHVLRLLGRHSLLVFVLHRIVMHFLLFVSRDMRTAPLAMTLFGVTLSLSVGACVLMHVRHVRWDQFRFWGNGEFGLAGAAAR